ncbi:MAG TPA: GNAT family N-acetyltransferase [Propionibacteriaceae bacterium]|nr:GNAT family N-acetyltransferase [Propionibacteriaceae bacterium]
MSDIVVEVLNADDWATYRAVRLSALEESPQAFTASYADESQMDESAWRDRMQRAVRFLATQDSKPLGVASLGLDGDDPGVGEVFGLYVQPPARNQGVSWRLVQAAAERARSDGLRSLHYWVGTENARAIAFAANFGFRPAGERRQTRVLNEEFGEQEIAMVLSLQADPGAVPNPNRGRVTPSGGAQS